MKISGRDAKPKGELPPLIFARTPVEDSIVFKFAPLPNYAEFDALCPPPVAPKMRTQHGVTDDTEAPGYLEAVAKRDRQRAQYMVLKTLEPSQLEFETVKFDDPSTWEGIDAELQAVLTEQEFAVLIDRVFSANVITERMLEVAAENFFTSQLQPG